MRFTGCATSLQGWLRGLFGFERCGTGRRGAAAAVWNGRRVGSESLESRLMPAVTFSFAYGGAIGSGIGFEDGLLGQARRNALESSAAAFGNLFRDTATISISVKSFADAGSNTLASAGGFFYSTSSSDIVHLIPATKILTGVDLNGPSPDGEMQVNWAPRWHLGDNPSSDEWDAKSVFTHELAHAIGFSSLIGSDGSSELMAAVPLASVDSVAVAEGGSTPFSVRLSEKPAGTVKVTISNSGGDGDLSVLSGSSLTFTTDNWNVPQTVRVGAAEDADAVNGATRLRIRRWDNGTEIFVTAVEADNEPLDIVLSSPEVVVAEQGTGTITLRLAAQPAADRTVSISRVSGDTDLSVVGPQVFTFTNANWNIPQTVTLAANADRDRQNGFATFAVTSGGLKTTALTLTERDRSAPWAEFDVLLSSGDGQNLIDAKSLILDADRWRVHSVGGPNGDGLYFNGYNARRVNGGAPVPIFSPNPWLDGSSGSHLDTTVPALSTMLMAHAATTGLRPRTLSPIEKAMFRDIGFSLTGIANEAPAALDDSGAGFSTNEDTPVLLPDVLRNDIDPDRRDQEGLFIRSLNTTGTRGKAMLAGTGLPQTFTLTGPAIIPDTQQPIRFQIPVTGVAGRIRDLDVRLSISHAYTEDLDVFLISPRGTRVELFTDVGPGSSNFVNTILSDEAFVSIEAVGASGPFTATYRPAELLSAFDGEDANGTWTLEVTDDFISGAGVLNDVSLIVRGQHIVYQPDGQFESLNDGQSAADLLTYIVEDSSGNTATASASIQVRGVTDQSLILSTSSIRVPEGGSSSFTVKLAVRPEADVQVSVARSGGDGDLSVSSGGTLTFTSINWNTPQVVTVSAASDIDLVDGTAVFSVTAGGLPQVTLEAVEQDLSSDILLGAVSASGGAELTIRYEIRGQSVGPFDISFLRSDADAVFGNDLLLDTIRITAAADLTPGLHVKTVPVGAGADAVALPGAGVAGSSDEYWLLVVADAANLIAEADAEAVTEDNLAVFSGVYVGAGVVVVHTGPGNDTVVITASGSSHSLQIGTQPAMLYSSSVFPQFSVRLHDGNDRLDARAATVRIFARGGAGDDTLSGGAAGDEIHGGDGVDTAEGGGGNDYITGGKGGDVLSGGDGIDTIAGGEGNDWIRGDAGSDVLQGDDGDDLLEDSTGDDRLSGGSGNDTLKAGPGFDILNGGPGNDSLSGGAENDLYVFTAAAAAETDTMIEFAGEGIDRLDFSELTDIDHLTLNLASTTTAVGGHNNRVLQVGAVGQAAWIESVTGGAGNDRLTGNAAANLLSGGPGNDTLIGNDGDDRLEGGGGNDSLDGGLNNDTFLFDADSPLGSDVLTDAGTGTDTIDFGATESIGVVLNLSLTGRQTVNGNLTVTLSSGTLFDHIVGTAKNDRLIGNSLTNRLEGRAGDDFLDGGSANDLYVFDTDTALGSDTVTDVSGTDRLDFSGTTTLAVAVNLGTSLPQIVNSNLTLTLTSATAIENVTGGTGSDSLTGSSLNNTLDGLAGDDVLDGLSGNDVLLGGSGSNSLTGGAGDDTLNGGSDSDVFVFDVDFVLGRDTITDTGGVDTLSFLLTTAVGISVNLALTTAQAVHSSNLTLTLPAGIVIENVLGSERDDSITGNDLNNVLVGNAGNDVLRGSAGRDILIGGLGADTIDGGLDDDILIAGRTTHDSTLNRLNDLRTEWGSANSYATRVSNLRSGVGAAAAAALQAKFSVLNDATSGAADLLTGGAGQDWYFRALDDVVSDLAIGETLDLL